RLPTEAVLAEQLELAHHGYHQTSPPDASTGAGFCSAANAGAGLRFINASATLPSIVASLRFVPRTALSAESPYRLYRVSSPRQMTRYARNFFGWATSPKRFARLVIDDQR